MITEKSRVKDIYDHPVGHDIIHRILLQCGMDSSVLGNPLVKNMTIGNIRKLSGRFADEDFWETLFALLNGETDRPAAGDGSVRPAWWKEAVFYQIYPRSFADGNGDGVGDLRGILSQLDYLKRLGIDAVWLSPVYDSPCDDNGYDIRDYYEILAQFGTMEDFDTLVHELHERGMRLIMDLVVNHTSDEHPWFQEAVADPDSPYHGYYFFRDGQKTVPPNNWTSFFSGTAWNYYEALGQWGLHLFSAKQMDLNWENPALRADICTMIRWWLEKGVDGFRLDVINYISKTPGLPQGNETIGRLMGFYGIEHYFYGPRLHEYLRQLRKEAFAPYDAFTVGETPGAGLEMGRLLTGDDRGELDMIFSFDHLENPGKNRFDDYRYDLNYLKKHLIEWTRGYGNRCWMSLFWENHDNPRMVSKVNPDPAMRVRLAKLLAAMQLTLRGTPFIYQGQELGTGNVDFQDISELSDVESLNLYQELCRTKTQEEAFRIILAGSRDHARAMMDWEEAAAQKQDHASVYYFYKRLIALRKKYPVLVYGKVSFTNEKEKDLFTWYRQGDERPGAERPSAGEAAGFYIECNLSSESKKRPERPNGYRTVLSNYETRGRWMQAYEVCICYGTQE
ncbi:MAG: alpha-glucosidase [Lachnospiraceae bacterium]|nr:alpha-glucosidase [Lachnospiraceae bacterium]